MCHFYISRHIPDKDAKLVCSDPVLAPIPVHNAEDPQDLMNCGELHGRGERIMLCAFSQKGCASDETNCFPTFPPCNQKLGMHATGHVAKLFVYAGRKSRRSAAALIHRSNKRKDKRSVGPSGLRGKAKPASQPTWLRR